VSEGIVVHDAQNTLKKMTEGVGRARANERWFVKLAEEEEADVWRGDRS